MLGRVLQPGLCTSGEDVLFTGIWPDAEDIVRIERVLGFLAPCPAPLTALLDVLFFPACLLFLPANLLFLAEARGVFLLRSLTALFLSAAALTKLFLGLGLLMTQRARPRPASPPRPPRAGTWGTDLRLAKPRLHRHGMCAWRLCGS